VYGCRVVWLHDDRNDYDDPCVVGCHGFYGIGCRERVNGNNNRYAVDYTSSTSRPGGRRSLWHEEAVRNGRG